MQMNFPEKVDFKLVDQKTKNPVGNVALLLQLYASKKNDYFIGPLTTDTEGLASFSREDCFRQIKNSKEFYLMDYASSLEECLPKITLKIVDPKQIGLIIEIRGKYDDFYREYWDCSESFLNRLENTDNDLYLSDSFIFEEAQLHQPGPIIIEVRRKPD